MSPFVTLRNIVLLLATRALQVHDAVRVIPLVSNIFGTFFYFVSSWLFDVALTLGDLASWYQRVADRLDIWLTSLDVLSIMSEFITRVNQVWVWFLERAGYLLAIVNNWWSGVRSTVLSWIETTKAYTVSLYDTLRSDVSSLRVSWDNFRTSILPGLATRTDVNILLLKALAPWVRSFTLVETFGKDIVSFFGDPGQWIYDRLDDFLGRFW